MTSYLDFSLGWTVIRYISQLNAFFPKIALGHGPYDCKRKQNRTGSDTKWALSKSLVLAYFLCGQLTCSDSRHDGSFT